MAGWDVQHLQFHQSPALRRLLRVLGVLTWPLCWPLAMLARTSDASFRSCSELLSLVPYVPGVIVRREFYRFALRHCGENLVVGFGAVLLHADIAVGDHTLIGRYCIVHHCDFGDYVVTGERCTFLSGAHYHHMQRTDVPMATQGGRVEPIAVESDVWIGSHSVVMATVGRGSVVGAGSVVVEAVPAGVVCAGNPAREIRRRGGA